MGIKTSRKGKKNSGISWETKRTEQNRTNISGSAPHSLSHMSYEILAPLLYCLHHHRSSEVALFRKLLDIYYLSGPPPPKKKERGDHRGIRWEERVQAAKATSSITEAVKIFSLLPTNQRQARKRRRGLFTVALIIERCLGEGPAFARELKFNELTRCR